MIVNTGIAKTTKYIVCTNNKLTGDKLIYKSRDCKKLREKIIDGRGTVSLRKVCVRARSLKSKLHKKFDWTTSTGVGRTGTWLSAKKAERRNESERTRYGAHDAATGQGRICFV